MKAVSLLLCVVAVLIFQQSLAAPLGKSSQCHVILPKQKQLGETNLESNDKERAIRLLN